MHVTYIQEPMEFREHSLWYGGRVAEVKHRGYTFILGAFGDVRATLLDWKNNEIAYVKDKYNAGRFTEEIGYYVKDDDALRRVINHDTFEDYRLYLDNNNWWEVLIDAPDGTRHDLGWVCESEYYTEAIQEVIEEMDRIIDEYLTEKAA